MPKAPAKLGVLNIGVTRYTQPLSATNRAKFSRLMESCSIAEMHVIGLSSGLSFEKFREGATFYLQPLLPSAALRFLLVVARAVIVGTKLGFTRRVQIVLCESPYEGLAGIVVRGLLRVCGRRVAVITELHGDWEGSPFLYRKVPFRFLVEPALDRWTKFVLRRSDALRAVSRSLAEKAESLGSAPVAARFPTFTDFDLFLEPPEAEPSRTPSILYVGGLYPIKGVDVLAESFSKLVTEGLEVKLVVVGEGPCRDWLESKLEPSVRRFVSLLGVLSQAEVRREMMKARLLVLPSRSEGLPRVIMEAMASALPVVATSVGGIPELVDDGSTGLLVPAGDPVQLARGLKELLEDEARAREMGRRGREKALAELSSENYFEGYRRLFESVGKSLAPHEER